METKERIVDAREVFAEMSIKIDRAETWGELMETIDSMNAIISSWKTICCALQTVAESCLSCL